MEPKEYIAGKDEYAINAALVLNYVQRLDCWGTKKNRLFYSYGKNNSFMIEDKKTVKLDCKKKTAKEKFLLLVVLKNHRL